MSMKEKKIKHLDREELNNLLKIRKKKMENVIIKNNETRR